MHEQADCCLQSVFEDSSVVASEEEEFLRKIYEDKMSLNVLMTIINNKSVTKTEIFNTDFITF